MTVTFYEDDEYAEDEHDVCWCGEAPCTHIKSQVTDVFSAGGWDYL